MRVQFLRSKLIGLLAIGIGLASPVVAQSLAPAPPNSDVQLERRSQTFFELGESSRSQVIARHLLMGARDGAQGGGGNIVDVEAYQSVFSDPVDGNIVTVTWIEETPNLSGVDVCLSNADGADLGCFSVTPVPSASLPAINGINIPSVPEGVITFRVTGLGTPLEGQVDQLVLATQPIADVTGVGCSEGAIDITIAQCAALAQSLGASTSCESILQWDIPDPVPDFYLVDTESTNLIQNISGSGITDHGAQNSLVFNCALPADYVVSVAAFMTTPDGSYLGNSVAAPCTLACTQRGRAPVDLDLAQLVYSEQTGNEVLVQWVNAETYTQVDVFVDGASLGFVGPNTPAVVTGLAPGDHVFGVRGDLGDGSFTALTTSTPFTVRSTTPHVSPVDGRVVAEFLPTVPAETSVNWMNDQPSAWLDVYRETAGTEFFAGTLPGTSTGFTLPNTLDEDVISLQFFSRDGDYFYGSDRLVGQSPGNQFIRGLCDGGNRDFPTVGTAVFGLNWLFAGGGDPPCEIACDADGDGNIVIGDMVYVIRFLFAGGPAPLGWTDPLVPGCEVAPFSRCASEHPAACP